LNDHLGRSSTYAQLDGKVWSITSQKQYDYVFSTFFRPFSDHVQRKPDLNTLLLIPVHMDTPILPNDIGDTS
jgi:hypothetical protein